MRFVSVQLQLEKHWCAVNRAVLSRVGFIVLSGMLAITLRAQTSGTKSDDASIAAKQGIDLAASGRCKEALPKLNHSIGQIGDKSLRYRMEMATARCAMSIDDTEMAVGALFRLRREFPGDPEVLYTTTHFFSELAMRSSQELAAKAPASFQAQQLEAEAFESQGKWDQAALQYQKILEGNPRTPGIHYRRGRIFLSKSPADEVNANKEFEEELKIDPESAPAEFMLGESARQAGRWDEAVTRFSKVTKLDEGFLEAYLALGMSLNAAGKFSDAIAPLQKYVKRQPRDPAGHYQLGMAYVRVGRKQDADHEMQMQQEAAAKAQGARNSER